jgi:hypothetical protein
LGVSVLRASLPRRLGAVLPPVQGEAFGSWVARMADDLDVPEGVAAADLGLQLRSPAVGVRPAFFGIALTEVSRQGLGAATGIETGVFDAMQLSAYAETALDLADLDLMTERSVQRLAVRNWP